MKISFERSGGFAGLRLRASFDTDELPPETGDLLKRLVEDASFFALPPVILGSPNAADVYQYEIVIEDETRSHKVTASEEGAPDALRPLLQALMRLARTQR